MKAAGQYFPVVLFTMLYKVVLIFESVPKILKWDIKASKHYFVCGAVYYAVHCRRRY